MIRNGKINYKYVPSTGRLSLALGLSGVAEPDTPPMMAAIEKAVALDDSWTALADDAISPARLSVREFSSESISRFLCDIFSTKFP